MTEEGDYEVSGDAFDEDGDELRGDAEPAALGGGGDGGEAGAFFGPAHFADGIVEGGHASGDGGVVVVIAEGVVVKEGGGGPDGDEGGDAVEAGSAAAHFVFHG